MKTENLYKIVPAVFSILVLCFAVVFYAVGWTGPTSNPPNDNTSTPINAGTSTQYKTGALGIGGVLQVDSITYLNGNVGIGTNSPQAILELEYASNDPVIILDDTLGTFTDDVGIINNGQSFIIRNVTTGLDIFTLDLSTDNEILHIGGEGEIILEGDNSTGLHLSPTGSPEWQIMNWDGNLRFYSDSGGDVIRFSQTGDITAASFTTGDIHFRHPETNEPLWRMFEDEEGLYLESQKTGKTYKFLLEEVNK